MGWKKQIVKQPVVVHAYNEGMYGVDKSNQYLAKYPCYVKTKFHWWKVLFFHCLDMMIVNSFVVFNEFRTQFPSKFDNFPQHFGQLEFRESIVCSLFNLLDDNDTSSFTGTNCMPEFTTNRLYCNYCHASERMKSLPLSRKSCIL